MKFTTYRLNEICDAKSGKRLPLGSDFLKEITKYKYIRARDIKQGKIDVSNCGYISEEVKKKISKYIIEENDVAITIVANIGDVGFCGQDASGANLTENAVRLTNFNPQKCFSKYLAYYLAQPCLKKYMEGLAIGAAQAKLGIYKVNQIKVQLPLVEEQKKITSIIENYDNLIENNNKRIKILEKMAENLYKEWFIRFRFPGHETTPIENGIPKGWKYKRADEVIDFNPTIKTDDQKSFTIIPMEALSTSSMVIDSNSFVIQNAISGRRSQNGDTLLAKITPCLENGKTGFVMGLPEGEVFGGSTEFIVMRSKTLTPHYVYCIARSQYFRQTAILSMNGADGRQRVDENKLKSTKILQPTQTLLNHFEKNISPLFESISRLVKENTNLIKQRDLLLPRLMSGKLAV